MKTTVKVEGLSDCEAGLGELSRALGLRILGDVAVMALEPMGEKAAQAAPDDPRTSRNDLKDNIVVSRRRPKASNREKKQSTVEAYMGPDASVPYAVVRGVQQEFGNINHGPQPFMRPAFDTEKLPTIKRVKDGLTERIEKARLRAARRQARLIKQAGG